MYLPFPEIEEILEDKWKKAAGWVDTEGFCDHCDKYTPQERRYSRHERDSSSDWFVCLECKWEYSGYDCKWSPP